MLTRTARVALNTLTNHARFGISLVVFFLLTPFVIRKVGESDFGLWSLTLSALGFFWLLDFGFGTGVVKYVAECEGSKDFNRRNRMLSTLAVVYVLLALIGAVALGVLSVFFNRLFSVAHDQHHKALALLWILGVRSVVLGLPLGLFRNVLFGEQRIHLLNLVQIGSTLLYGLASWMALERGLGVIGLAWINVAATLVEHMAYVCLAFRYAPNLRISWSLADRSLFTEATSFSLFAFLASAAVLILLNMDPIIIKLFLPLSAVATYVIALKIAEKVYLFTKLFAYVLNPFVAELKGKGEEDKIRFVLVNCTRFALVPAVLLAVIGYAFSREAIVLWVGPQFAAAAPVLVILLTAMMLSVPQMTAATVFTMAGNPSFTAFVAVISIFVNAGMSLALVRPLGLSGVALGTLTATVLVDFLLLVGMACRAYRVTYRTYARRAVLMALLPGLPQFAVTYALKCWVPPTSLLTIAWEALPGAVLYGVIFWLFCVEPTEKRLFAEKLFKWRHGPEPPVAEKAEASRDENVDIAPR